jgi:threonine aldolase
MKWRRKRSGHTLSKGRLIGAQFEGLLGGGHWLDLARHANAMAAELAGALAAQGVPLAWPCQANEVFPIVSAPLQQALQQAGFGYVPWSQTALPRDIVLEDGAVVGRFVMSFATGPQAVARLIEVFAAARS